MGDPIAEMLKLVSEDQRSFGEKYAASAVDWGCLSDLSSWSRPDGEDE